MKILVVGGCGFIGSHVVDALLARGARVRVLDRSKEQYRDPLPSVEYVQGGFSDSSLINEALLGMDGVVHLASTTVPMTSNLDPVGDIMGNLIGTMKLIKGMRHVGVKNLIYSSSGGTVYGIPKADPIPEDHPLQPISSYGIVKATIEKYLFMENQLHGLRYCALRASNPYGPRQGHRGVQGVIGTYLWRVARNEPIEVWGDGSVVRDFFYVTDLAELCVLALYSQACGVFNAGSGQGASVLDVIEMVQKTTGQELTPVFKPGQAFDVPRSVLDVTRARTTFNWAPELDLLSGIARSWDWVLHQIQS
ncbi:MAG: NAD-dependent epimerase/dehydratase family protein [Jhaorihella sp.]